MHIKTVRIIFLILLIFFVSGCRRPALNRRKTSAVGKSSNAVHTVKKGDTLYSISRLYNVSIQNLIDSNQLKNPNVLSLGQQIKISNTVTNLQTKTQPVVKTDKSITPVSKQKRPVSKPKNPIKENNVDKNQKNFIPPVKGNSDIVFRFGDMKNGIRVDGLEYKIKSKSSIVSSCPGDVVYVDSDSKNKIIIIEHKNNFYTVYSNLSDVNVKMGDVVIQAYNIGSADKNTEFYFELRKFVSGSNPQALNPEEFFQTP